MRDLDAPARILPHFSKKEQMYGDLSYNIVDNDDRSNGLIDFRVISRVLGVLLLFESGLMLLCMVVSAYYGDGDFLSFVYSVLLCVPVGCGLLLLGLHSGNRLMRREAYLIVGLSWVMFTSFGMLPFCIEGFVPSVTDAFFETMSGFTTTGATVLDNIESMPHGLLFWRSLTQWVGGVGIVFFTIALLPDSGSGGQMLFLSEATGVTHDKTHPKTRVMVRCIGYVYVALTITETLLLMAGGMGLFDAVCHSFATTATGGFSTKQDSIAYWSSPYIEYVVTVFMLLSAINFSLYFFVMKGRGRQLLDDEELRWFLKSVGILTAVIALALVIHNGYAPEEAFRKALFQVATCHTSCGFATDDYNLWPPFTWMLLVFAMLSGGNTGSTSGGMKNMRLLVMSRSIMNQFRQILYPRAVLPMRVNGKVLPQQLVAGVMVFVVSYMLCIFVGWVLLMSFGVGMTEAMSTVVSSIGNVGPGLGGFGPAFSWSALPDAGKWVLSALMLVGRLEIFGVLMAFYPGLWRNN